MADFYRYGFDDRDTTNTITVNGKSFFLFSHPFNGRHFPTIGPIPQDTVERILSSIKFQEQSAQGYASKGEAIIEAIRLALSVTAK